MNRAIHSHSRIAAYPGVSLRRLTACAALAATTLGGPAMAQSCAGFTDVAAASTFCPNVEWIRNRAITLGCGGTSYCPDAPVSRLAIAAFLNRLGDVLLPPNVIRVAPVGGQFQSIQSAIDHAASLPGPARRLVKVAPGTYSEAIVMASNVDVEGSGPGSTIISATVCSPGRPATGTVRGASNAQLRDVTVSMDGSVPFGQCAAVYLDGVNGTALRNVHVAMRIAGGGPISGIIVDWTNPTFGWSLTLDTVRVDAFDLGASRTGILIDPAFPGGSTRLQDVTISGLAENAPVVGLRVVAGDVFLDRTRSIIGLGVPPGTPAVALRLEGTARVTVERSALSWPAGAYAEVAGSATLRIAHSMLQGSLSGTATCAFNYDASFAPATC